MRSFLLIITICWSPILQGQVQDSFADGNLDQNPTWIGDSADFKVNPAKELQLDAPSLDASSSLVTASQSIGGAEWRFFTRLAFPPSGSNYLDVYLTASDPKLDSAQDAYFVRIGDSEDEVSLYRQNGKKKSKLIDGKDGRVDQDPVTLSVRVTRTGTGHFELELDTGGGSNFLFEGSSYDASVQKSTYFGFHCQYTATRSDAFFFDRIEVSGSPFQDSIPPQIEAFKDPKKGVLELHYDEALDPASFQAKAFELLPLGIGPDSLLLTAADHKLTLFFPSTLQNDSKYTLSVPSVKDTAGNPAAPEQLPFHHLIPASPEKGAVVINEIMADPSPPVGLPDGEYLELHAADSLIQDLEDWTLIVDGDSSKLPQRTLRPGDRVLLIEAGDSSLFTIPSPLLLNPLPSLTNGGERVELLAENGERIDQVHYKDDWYGDKTKEDGGWSLERIAPGSLCQEQENWKASTDPEGGTPGAINSLYDPSYDTKAPTIKGAHPLNASTILLRFDEGIFPDTALKEYFSIPKGPDVDTAFRTSLGHLRLRTESSLDTGRRYHLKSDRVPDCFGNEQGSPLKTSFLLPYGARKKDVVINEVLFDPMPDGVDFVECYNRSERTLDLSDWTLASFEDSITDREKVPGREQLIPPGSYRFLTKDTTIVKEAHPGTPIGRGVAMKEFPTYTNDSGTVVLLNQQGALLDRFAYNAGMHHSLLQEQEGVSLERIDPEAPTDHEDNWHSAASSVNYATPGEKNSQFRSSAKDIWKARLWTEPEVFSPNMDGDRDHLKVRYRFSRPGMNCSLRIHTARGRVVKELADGQLLGRKGSFTWSGTLKDGSKAPIGIYVILLECIHPDGKRVVEKETCVVGTR